MPRNANVAIAIWLKAKQEKWKNVWKSAASSVCENVRLEILVFLFRNTNMAQTRTTTATYVKGKLLMDHMAYA